MHEPEHENEETSVVPDTLGVSHRLKMVVGPAGVRVVFSAPNKLGKKYTQVNVRLAVHNAT